MSRNREHSAADGGRRAQRSEPGASAVRQASSGLPTVVLVGRANAGKSTLFNRIARGSRAIVTAIPGTTRDLNFARASHEGCDFVIVDSGGLELGGREPLNERIVAEALGAVGVADVVVFLLDGRAGLADADKEALALVRETGAPLILAVNKLDQPRRDIEMAEFYELGAERLFSVSAAHGRGVGELLDEVIAKLPLAETTSPQPPELKLALVGRPNVGKSSLLNRLAGFERAIVDDAPGTTRDALDVRLTAAGRDLLLIDTAGIRRPTRVEGDLEQHSVGRAISTIRRADVVLLVIDASEGITDQDARLARLVDTNDRALVIVCNKWDLVAARGGRTRAFVRDAQERYPFLGYATLLCTSALKGDGVRDIVPAALRAGDAFRATFQTSHLNRVLADATAAMDPPVVGRRRLNLMYVTQVASAPPRLRFFSNLERDIPPHYVRFLETRFRKALELTGTPLRLEFRRTGRSPARSFSHRSADSQGRE